MRGTETTLLRSAGSWTSMPRPSSRPFSPISSYCGISRAGLGAGLLLARNRSTDFCRQETNRDPHRVDCGRSRKPWTRSCRSLSRSGRISDPAGSKTVSGWASRLDGVVEGRLGRCGCLRAIAGRGATVGGQCLRRHCAAAPSRGPRPRRRKWSLNRRYIQLEGLQTLTDTDFLSRDSDGLSQP